jgi:hypothetical protein
MVGEIGGKKVRVFDDNADGIYGGPSNTWEHTGLRSGDSQPELDSVSIGGEKRCVPWSKYLEVDGTWYELESKNGGTQLLATPVELEIGTIKLKYKGTKPAWLILRFRNKVADACFDISDGSAEVPAGTYELLYGELRKGKKLQMLKAVILPGPTTPTWTVSAGGTATVELGAPYGFDFLFEVSGETLVLTGNSVTVVGSGGERYERLWGCVPKPEVTWRPAGSKRASKPEDMELAEDLNGMGQEFWTACWFPLNLSLELRGSPEAVELQLTEKKNKLFGAIQSEWKGK